MLKRLNINNIILIESSEIPFDKGFNVLSGETGAGKSAILQALSLILGERADSHIIRKGSIKASVEALFEFDSLSLLPQKLQEMGIDCDDGEVIIRREIHSNGKNRCYINHQLAQLKALQQISRYLAEHVGQHAGQLLFSLEEQRRILDDYHGNHQLIQSINNGYHHLQELKATHEMMIRNESARLRKIDSIKRELSELQEANVKNGEEEVLFQEYTKLVHQDEIHVKSAQIHEGLGGSRTSIVPALARSLNALENLKSLDPYFQELEDNLKSALREIEEVTYTLQNYQRKLTNNPHRLNEINDRLTTINALKRKYGKDSNELNPYCEKLQEELDNEEMVDWKLQELLLQIAQEEENLKQLCVELTQLRIKSSKQLQQAITEQVQSLNMQKAEVSIVVITKDFSENGSDHVEFYLAANPGEHERPLKECASGGEISRLYLAIKVVMAGKKSTPLMIFDEIDANIGGHTATIIGQKLLHIAQSHQIMCVTHLAQVAQFANHHLHISKKEEAGRTLSIVKELDEQGRIQEFARMRGTAEIDTIN
ncbi:MAG: DNA repair protein RecN [Parachlamydiales bacterium]|nr:DNA repair protein RecN [Parachlamydiales bacterium]